jgi:CheY-like chemotaxis protein
VLIVDGQQDRLALNALGLTMMGFDVLAANDSVTALGRVSTRSPNIIVTDLILRQASGWDLLSQLKSDPLTCDIPVVMLTGSAAFETRERAMREGCAALIVTPCLPDRLAVELRMLLLRHRATDRVSAVN